MLFPCVEKVQGCVYWGVYLQRSGYPGVYPVYPKNILHFQDTRPGIYLSPVYGGIMLSWPMSNIPVDNVNFTIGKYRNIGKILKKTEKY